MARKAPVKQLQVWLKHGATEVHVWRDLRKGCKSGDKTNPLYRFKGRQHKERALDLVVDISMQHNVDYEISDQRGVSR